MNAPKKERKPRNPPKRGVRFVAQAFCDVCGWRGANFFGKGSARNAAAELKWHRDTAKCE